MWREVLAERPEVPGQVVLGTRLLVGVARARRAPAEHLENRPGWPWDDGDPTEGLSHAASKAWFETEEQVRTEHERQWASFVPGGTNEAMFGRPQDLCSALADGAALELVNTLSLDRAPLSIGPADSPRSPLDAVHLAHDREEGSLKAVFVDEDDRRWGPYTVPLMGFPMKAVVVGVIEHTELTLDGIVLHDAVGDLPLPVERTRARLN